MWYRELLLAHNITVKGIGQQKNICFSLGFQSDEFLRLYFQILWPCCRLGDSLQMFVGVQQTVNWSSIRRNASPQFVHACTLWCLGVASITHSFAPCFQSVQNYLIKVFFPSAFCAHLVCVCLFEDFLTIPICKQVELQISGPLQQKPQSKSLFIASPACFPSLQP